jgi:amino acid adenylation domain-containing protein
MKIADIEAIYPLAPTQEAILLSSFYDSAEAKVCCQLVCEINGRIESALFERAWVRIIEECQLLRASFIWKRLNQPRQMIHKSLTVSITEQDWQNLTSAEQDNQLEMLIHANRTVGLDPRNAPLMRFSLARKSDDVFVFVWSYHPVLLDSHSARVVFNDVLSSYERLRDKRALKLKERLPFRDYILWARNRTSSATDVSWVELIGGTQSPTNLILDRDRSHNCIGDARAAEQRRALPNALFAKLQATANERHLELETLFLGAWAKVIGRYSSQDTVVFAVTNTECDSELDHLRSIPGPFTTTLPIAIRIDSQMIVEAWLAELDARWRKHQQLAFATGEQLDRMTRILKDAASHGARIEFERRSSVEKYQGLRIKWLETLDQRDYPLSLKVSLSGVAILGIRYPIGLYDPEVIERIFGLLHSLLEAICERPRSSLLDLPTLTAPEHEQLLVALNDTQRDILTRSCAHELVEEQAERTPERIAVTFRDEILSYGELNRRANQLARQLRKMGLGPDVFVGIAVRRSIDLIISILATLKAGGAYVPLDLTYPKGRLNLLIEDAGLTILLTEDRVADEFPMWMQVVRIDSDWDLISQESDGNLARVIGPENLAYVIYTSGSTGKPKGVMIPHRALINYLTWCVQAYNVAGGEGAPVHSSIGFDLTITALLAPLIAGRKISMMPEEVGVSQLKNSLIAGEGFSLVKVTPSHLDLLRHIIGDEEMPHATNALIIGGESLYGETLSYWRSKNPAVRIVNEYGPTEATVGCIVYHVGTDESIVGAVPIGRPIANTQAYLLDHNLQPVPAGVPGDLYVGGMGLARGYLNSPDLTGERFIPHLFSKELGSRLYKTGDRGRYRLDGNIECLGREDNQVKIRGHRVELGEIESVLISHSSVRDAVVAMNKSRSPEQILVAYLILEPGEKIEKRQIHSFLRERLPDYMTPSTYVILDTFPLTENGKTDRQSLPEPDFQRFESESASSPPGNPIEEILAAIWMDVLHVGEIGMNDNFFELGGHSLLATQVISRIRESFDVEIPLHGLFEFPTIASLAHSLAEAKWARLGEMAAPIKPVQRDGDLPLSFAQLRLWFIDQMQPGSPAYNAPQSVRLIGELNVDALQRTLSEIVRRHEVLRTTFALVGGEPVQRVNTARPITMPMVDLSELNERAITETRRLAVEESARPFDLERDLMIRTTLVRTGEEDHVVLFTMHHIVSDGWSQGVLMREVSILYEAFSEGMLAPLEELPIQYGDFAVWQREWLSGEVLEEQLGYWKRQLGGAARMLEIPSDKPRPSALSYRGAVEPISLNNKVRDGLRDLNRREGVTMFMTLLAVLKLLLYKYSGQEGISVGTGVANRTRKETEGLIGFFVNTLVLRTDLSGGPTFRELLKREREVVLEAYAHQDIPFEMLVEELEAERDLRHTPLFQVLFVLQNVSSEPLRMPGLTLNRFNVERSTAKFDIYLSMQEDANGIQGLVEYNTDIFKAETISRMIKNYSALVEDIIQDPDRHINDISTISEEESQLLICEFNED